MGSQVSTVGWVIFFFGLMCLLIGCIIGLLFRENVRICAVCGRKIG
jgi:hypothetical protein